MSDNAHLPKIFRSGMQAAVVFVIKTLLLPVQSKLGQAMKAFAPLLALTLSVPMPAVADSNWSYITDNTENTLYFGRNIRHREGITFVEIKMEDNPAGNNGDKNSWNQAFNCKNKTWRQNNVGFVPIKKGQVNFDWFKFACKKVVNHNH